MNNNIIIISGNQASGKSHLCNILANTFSSGDATKLTANMFLDPKCSISGHGMYIIEEGIKEQVTEIVTLIKAMPEKYSASPVFLITCQERCDIEGVPEIKLNR